jgi:hypothetical protein
MEKYRQLHATGTKAIDAAHRKGEKHVTKVKKQIAKEVQDNHVSKKDKAILAICKIDEKQLGTAMQVVKAGSSALYMHIFSHLLYLSVYVIIFIHN